MAAFDQIGGARAAIKLGIAKALGIVIQLSHRGAANVSLYVRVAKESVEKIEEAPGIVAELRYLTLEIPVQTNFARPTGDTEPITPFDQITYLSRKYFVMEPVDKDPGGFVYTVKCLEKKRLASGA